MANPGLSKTRYAAANISAYTIVKPSGVNPGEAVPAAAATDALLGVAQNVDVMQGQYVDVIIDDIANVKLGGNVAENDPITSDANGNGVTAAPAAGANVRIIGFAQIPGVAGDIVPVLIAPGYMQG